MASSRGPPRKELKNKKWEIENFVGGEPVTLAADEVQKDQTLYIAHCADTVIQVCTFCFTFDTSQRAVDGAMTPGCLCVAATSHLWRFSGCRCFPAHWCQLTSTPPRTDYGRAQMLPLQQRCDEHPMRLWQYVQVQGKVNSVMLDACKKVGLVFEAVVASFEAVNCSSLQIQCTGTCPSLAIDKTDGVQVC